MPWQDAIDQFHGGVSILLEVRPKAAEAKFPAGYNRWRRRLVISVTSPAVDGLANAHVVRMVADFFDVRPADVTMIAGARSKMKRVVVRRRTWDFAVGRLEGKM